MSQSASEQASTSASAPSQELISDDVHNESVTLSSDANASHQAGLEAAASTGVLLPPRSDSLTNVSTSAVLDGPAEHGSPPLINPVRRPVYKKKLSIRPKGILKPAPPPQKAFSFRRDILQNLNTRLAQQGVNVQVPVPQAGTAQATASYIGGMFRRIGGIAAGAAANVGGAGANSTAGYAPGSTANRTDINDASGQDSDITLAASRSSIASQSSESTLPAVTSATPLKKVQFQVSQMTVTYPIVGAGAPEDEDLTRLRIEREHRRSMKARRGKPWTPQELETLYRECCRTREEHPLKKMRLVFQEASQSSPPALKTMDLSFVPLDRHAVEPIADLLSVDFGLNKLVLENCALTDNSVKSLLHALLVSGSLPNLSLASNRKIRYHGWRYVAIFMRRARALRYLDLSENSINKASLEHILQAIAKPDTAEQATKTTQDAANPDTGNNAEEDEDDEFFDDAGAPLMPTAPLLRHVPEEDGARTSAVISLRLENCGLKTSTLEMLSHAVRNSDIRHLSLRRNRINQLASVALAIMLKDYPDRATTSAVISSTVNEGQSYFDQGELSTPAPPVISDTQERPGRSQLPVGLPPGSHAHRRSYSPSLPDVPMIVSSPGGGFTSRKMPALNGLSGSAFGANADQIHEAMTHNIGSPTRELDARLTSEERQDIRRNAAPNLSEEEAIAIYQAKRAKRILADLPRVGNLLTLDLKSNDIRGGVVYLAQVLRKNRTLRVLNLSDNSIEIPGLVAIADALKYNSTLETLDLSHNPCSGPGLEGITTLRTAFALNSNLKRLFLNDTDLSSEAAIALAEFLPEARSLIHLDLAENYDIDIAGVMALAVSLRMNHSLRCLDLNIPANNPDFARLSQEILQSCVRNTELAQKKATQKGLKQPIPALIYKSVVARAVRENDERLKAAEDAAQAAAGTDTRAIRELLAAAAECHKELINVLETEQDKPGEIPETVSFGDDVQSLKEQGNVLRTQLGKLASTLQNEVLLEKVLSIHDALSDVSAHIDSLYSRGTGREEGKSLPSTPLESGANTSHTVYNRSAETDDSDDNSRIAQRSSAAATLTQTVDRLRIDTAAAADREEPDSDDEMISKNAPRSPSEDRAKGQLSEEGELFRKAKSLGLDDEDEEAEQAAAAEASPRDTTTGASTDVEDQSAHIAPTSSHPALSGSPMSANHSNVNADMSGEELRQDLLEASVPPKPSGSTPISSTADNTH